MSVYRNFCIVFVGLTAVLLAACTGTSEPEVLPTPIIQNPTTVPVVETDPTPIPIQEEPTAVPVVEEEPTAIPIVEAEPTAVPAEEAPIPQNDPIRVQFDPGTTSATLSGTLVNGETQTYLLGAQEGQALTAVFNSTNTNQAVMSVGINGQPIVDSQPSAALILPQTGDYALTLHGRDAAAPYAYQFTVEISALPTGLPLENLTYADRATWLSFVGAPAECTIEDERYRSSDTSGITFHPVASNSYVVQITCETFAYSSHARLYLFDANNNSNVQLLVPEFDPTVGVVLTRDILWGSSFRFDETTQLFTNYQKYRGLGDCGALNSYQLADNRLTLIKSRQQDCLDGEIAPPAQEWPIVYPAN
ncbi:MAG: DUF1176 domain-containing protein [Chloroflexota bacterium]